MEILGSVGAEAATLELERSQETLLQVPGDRGPSWEVGGSCLPLPAPAQLSWLRGPWRVPHMEEGAGGSVGTREPPATAPCFCWPRLPQLGLRG